jgi:hypothetical protein
VSITAGIAELVPQDDVDSFVARAEVALADAKRARRGPADGTDAFRPRAGATVHEIGQGEIVVEG